MPLDPSYPPARIKLIEDDAGLKVLLVMDEDAFADHSNVVKCPVLSVTNILDDALIPEPNAVDWCPPAPNTSCYIIYTSGTTEKPKGVVLEHANISCFIQYGALHLSKGLGPGSRYLLSSPMTFDMSCAIHFPTLSMGATLVVAPKRAFLDELELLINTVKVSWLTCHSGNITHMLEGVLWLFDTSNVSQVTHLDMTPSHFHLVVNCDLPSVECIVLGGERVPQQQLETWQNKVKHFVISYGPTETTIGCTLMEFDYRTEHASSNIIGLPFPNVTYYVLDTHLQPLPVGVMGELYIGGDGVGRGYLNRPDLTRKAFIKNPFSSGDGNRIYKTGDMVKLLPDGSIFFIGRNDGQIKIRGQRVELG
ncbi:MAG: AMP-binding protein, partial [Hyphomicrobiales bacterium]|nr:AMP-binding protein [Hyphomicrobiales bacterium]